MWGADRVKSGGWIDPAEFDFAMVVRLLHPHAVWTQLAIPERVFFDAQTIMTPNPLD
jgi:hypothetical protein